MSHDKVGILFDMAVSNRMPIIISTMNTGYDVISTGPTTKDIPLFMIYTLISIRIINNRIIDDVWLKS